MTLNIAGATSDADAQAFGFNGSSTGLVATQSPIAGPQTFSVEAWFRTNTATGGKIVGFGNAATGTSGSYDRHIYMRNNGQLTFGVYPNAVKTVTSAASFNDGDWHHAVATLGADGMALFVDGTEVGRDATVTSAQNYNGYWRAGGDNINGWPGIPRDITANRYFDGDIDEVAVYNQVLPAADIAYHHTVGAQRRRRHDPGRRLRLHGDRPRGRPGRVGVLRRGRWRHHRVHVGFWRSRQR